MRWFNISEFVGNWKSLAGMYKIYFTRNYLSMSGDVKHHIKVSMVIYNLIWKVSIFLAKTIHTISKLQVSNVILNSYEDDENCLEK